MHPLSPPYPPSVSSRCPRDRFAYSTEPACSMVGSSEEELVISLRMSIAGLFLCAALLIVISPTTGLLSHTPSTVSSSAREGSAEETYGSDADLPATLSLTGLSE